MMLTRGLQDLLDPQTQSPQQTVAVTLLCRITTTHTATLEVVSKAATDALDKSLRAQKLSI